MIIDYKQITYKDFQDIVKLDPVIFIPNSPFEVHGLHLPLAADILQAEKMAQIMAEEGNKKFPEKPWIIFPAIPAGIDPIPAKGSINYNFHFMVELLKNTAGGILKSGIKNIIFTNFHGAPRHMLAHDIVSDFVNNSGGKSFSPFGLLFMEFLNKDFNESIMEILKEKDITLETDPEHDIHAGFFETSILLAISDNVDNLYKNLSPLNAKEELKEIVNILSIIKSSLGIFSKETENFIDELSVFLQLSVHFRKNSYLGDPAKASKEIGEKILEKIRQKLSIMLDEFLSKKNIRKNEMKSPVWKNRKLLSDKVFDKILSEITGIK